MPQPKNSKAIRKIKGSIKTYKSRLNNHRYKNWREYPEKINVLEFKLGELEGRTNYDKYLEENNDLVIENSENNDSKMNEITVKQVIVNNKTPNGNLVKENLRGGSIPTEITETEKVPLLKKLKKLANLLFFEDFFK